MVNRRNGDPCTGERDYSDEEIEFMTSLDDYKRRTGRIFPTASEVLGVVKAIGFERTEGNLRPRAQAKTGLLGERHRATG